MEQNNKKSETEVTTVVNKVSIFAKIKKQLKRFTLLIVVASIVFVGMYLFRYLVQSEIVDFVTHLPWVLPMVLVIFTIFNKARHTKADKEAKFTQIAKAKTLRTVRFLIAFVLIWISFAFMPDIYNFVRQGIHYAQLNKIELDRLPNTKYEIPFPNKAVKSYIDERGSGDIYDCSYPWVVWIGDPTPVGERPNIKFSCALEPDPQMGLQKATKNVEEILLLDAYSNLLQVETRISVNSPISGTSYSAHNRPLEIIMRRLGLIEYLSMKPARFGYLPVIKNGIVVESYIVVSMIKYAGFFRKPKFGGVYLIPISKSSGVGAELAKATTGIGTYLTPQQCQSDQYWFLNHQDLIPHEVAVYNANTFRFKTGWWKALPGVREHSDVPNNKLIKANQQPYLSYYDFSKTKVKITEGFYDACFLETYKQNNRQRTYSVYSPVTGEDIVYFYDHMLRNENLKGTTSIVSDYMSQVDDKMPDGTEFIGASEFIPSYLKYQKVFYVTNRVIHDSVSNEYISQSPPWIVLTPVDEDKSFEFKNGWNEEEVKKALMLRYGAEMFDTTVTQQIILESKNKSEESIDSIQNSKDVLPSVDSLRRDTIDGG